MILRLLLCCSSTTKLTSSSVVIYSPQARSDVFRARGGAAAAAPKIDLNQTRLSAAIYPSPLTDWMGWGRVLGCNCSVIIIKDTHRVRQAGERAIESRPPSRSQRERSERVKKMPRQLLQERQRRRWSRRSWMMCVISVCDNYDRMMEASTAENVFLFFFSLS